MISAIWRTWSSTTCTKIWKNGHSCERLTWARSRSGSRPEHWQQHWVQLAYQQLMPISTVLVLSLRDNHSSRHSSVDIRNRIYSTAKINGSWISRCASANSSRVRLSSAVKTNHSSNSVTENNHNSAGTKAAINAVGIRISAAMRCSIMIGIVLECLHANVVAGSRVLVGTWKIPGL